ncbi:gamma-glutamyl-gamma-aminobutyrate hydrolase family protein [uncultured Draconibacterium sp.]|uniref:gamma-glutamyl-gamma-aminobutyrate hydrolase family protein n=1 Tax=uncultured Draconibacterium sp. TaxID=1573823 RepID=UPI0025E155C3|nr:gamma-glutamyl-gamma-aminobutyrate hydrolase family protein [uncultured Draconibacterium sp.]
MKKLLTLLFSLIITTSAFAQAFFNTEFNKRKQYIILCDPTIQRIKTIQYLTDANLFDVKNKVRFVGVYFEDQKYDFEATKNYIEENKLDNFYLHEIKGELNTESVYRENDISDDLATVFKHSIGVIFFGGPDIQPELYGEENTLSVVTDPERHLYECSFMFHLLGGLQNTDFKAFLEQRPDYVVTGFCLGMQTMNVATGGTLIQDIPAERYDAFTPEETVGIGRTNLHRNYWHKIKDDSLFMFGNLHTINFTDHPFFGQAVKVSKRSTPRIYSSHHQAAEKIGKDLEVTALSPDGKIIEGLAHHKYKNVFAVQFHPEIPALYEEMYRRKFHPDDEAQSYKDIIGKQGLRFHEAYWRTISDAFKSVKKKKYKKAN